MDKFLTYFGFFSLTIPFIISVLRYRKMDERYAPFTWMIWCGVFNEAGSILLIKLGFTNLWLMNLYVLTQALLLCELFRRWQLYSHYRWLYPVLVSLLAGGWLLELGIRGSILPAFSMFIVGSSLLIVFSSIQGVHAVLFKEPTNILRNPVFLLSIGFVLFFTLSILVEMFWFYGLTKNRLFRIRVYRIFKCANVITNFIYAYALLWIPLKRRYWLQS